MNPRESSAMADAPVTRRGLLAGAAAGAALASTRLVAQPAQPPELLELGVDEASRRIAAKQLSPLELTRAYLDRIERLNPRINAYITVTAEQAIAQARALEAELAVGRRRGPLHGIPIALKDNIDTAGIRTTAASALFADRVPSEDAEVVRRLREAGAIFLGKLNMHEFAYGGTSVVTYFGPVRNPWNLDFSPGGSSGGSAAAVAARLCAAALGTDTAASIRMPAAFCGVAGFKATHGLASIRGIIPLSETHDHVGPLARSVADCALVMNALAGFDPQDAVSIRSTPTDYAAALGREVSALRIGAPRTPFFSDLDPEIQRAVGDALDVIGGLTSAVRDLALPAVDTFPVIAAEIYAYHAKYASDPERRKRYDPLTLGRILDGAGIPLPVYVETRRQMAIARNTIADVFADVDLLVTPTTMAMPPAVAAALAEPPDEARLIRNTVPFNSLGLPTISVPCGFTRSGLPVGLQITGPRLGEPAVLALAHAYEGAAGWRRRAPALGAA
jgi:aspartyl-tRNA(Asn)/glutamyl-tRNA(Gln) amidotransferase subunit A